jgi:DNA-directed RNA polymerase subunit RPC12/RpoP
MQNVISVKYIKEWLADNDKNFEYIEGEYKNAFSRLLFSCLKCGETFYSYWQNIYIGCGCPYCSGKKVGKSNCLATKKPDLIVEWDYNKNKLINPYNVTISSHEKVWWKCSKNHSWIASVNNRTNKKSNCPYCSGRLPTLEENLFKINPELCKEWDYSTNRYFPNLFTPYSNKKVAWVCNKCGCKWQARIALRSQGGGCPICNKSKGENKIMKFLNRYNIYYLTPYSFKECRDKHALLFDFYIPQYNVCIEYQGIQHFLPIDFFGGMEGYLSLIKRDNIKKRYCQEKSIKLIAISYNDFNKIDNILYSECGSYIEK